MIMLYPKNKVWKKKKNNQCKNIKKSKITNSTWDKILSPAHKDSLFK